LAAAHLGWNQKERPQVPRQWKRSQKSELSSSRGDVTALGLHGSLQRNRSHETEEALSLETARGASPFLYFVCYRSSNTQASGHLKNCTVPFWTSLSFCFLPFLTDRSMHALTLFPSCVTTSGTSSLLQPGTGSSGTEKRGSCRSEPATCGHFKLLSSPTRVGSEHLSHPKQREHTISSLLLPPVISKRSLSWQNIFSSAVRTGNRGSSFCSRYGQGSNFHFLAHPAYHNSDKQFCCRKQKVFSTAFS